MLVGGTSQAGNWDTSVNWETAKIIWDSARRLVPELNDSNVHIIEHCVGLRPAREGGPRVESQIYSWPERWGVNNGDSAVKTNLVVHAYGFG